MMNLSSANGLVASRLFPFETRLLLEVLKLSLSCDLSDTLKCDPCHMGSSWCLKRSVCLVSALRGSGNSHCSFLLKWPW